MEWVQSAAATVEALTYLAVAILIVRFGPEGRMPFVRWWQLNALGVATTPMMVLLVLSDPGAAWGWFGLWLLAVAASLFGTGLITAHLYYLVRGKHILPEFLWTIVTAIYFLAIGNVYYAGLDGVHLERGFVVPDYTSEPSGFIFALMGAMTLPALILAAALAIASRDFAPADRRRALLVAGAVWAWFVSKALIGAALSTGEVDYVLYYRAMSLAAGALGLAAYWPARSSATAQ